MPEGTCLSARSFLTFSTGKWYTYITQCPGKSTMETGGMRLVVLFFPPRYLQCWLSWECQKWSFENKFWIVYNPQTEMFLLFNSYTPYFLNPKNSSTHLYFSSNLTPDDFELFLKVISTTVARCIFQRCLQESPPPRSSYSETLSRAVEVSCSSALLVWNTHSWNASTTPWGSPNRPVQGPHWETTGRRAPTIAHTARHEWWGLPLPPTFSHGAIPAFFLAEDPKSQSRDRHPCLLCQDS